MSNNTDYDKDFNLSSYGMDAEAYKTAFKYLDDREQIIDYQLRIYSESSAKLIKALHIIPKEYYCRWADSYEDNTGLDSTETSFGFPGVTFFLEVSASEEERLLLLMSQILEALP